MPAANASGDLFSLSGDARYEGVVTGRAGAGGRLSVTLEAEACHGLSLEAGARALVEVNGLLSLILGVRVTGFATAAAGVAAQAQLRPDAFERFGVIANVAAFAEASAGGRLAITGDISPIMRWASEHVEGLALELFVAFLEEASIEAGAWAQVSAAAMARAHAEVVFSLREPDAGVVIEAGAAAGLGAGAGYDFYCAARFLDVRRFYGRAVRAITREAARLAREQLPAPWTFGADVIEIALPTALLAAFELGQQTALGTLAPPEDMVQPLLSAFALSLRDYLLQAALRALPDVLAAASSELADWVEHGFREDGESTLEARLAALEAHVQANVGRNVELADLPVLGGLLLDVAEAVSPDEVAPWRHTLALLWCGMAVVRGLDRPIAQGSWSGSVIGLGRPGNAGAIIELPDPPAFVSAELRQRLGSDELSVDAAIAFIADGVAALVLEQVPEASLLLGELGDDFGIGATELFQLVLAVELGQDLTATMAYQRVRGRLGLWLDDTLLGQVLPVLRSVVSPLGADYVREVAAPSLQALSSFLLTRLDIIVGNGIPGDANVFTEKLSAGCSTLAYRIVMRNALYLDHVMLGLVLDGTQAAFSTLEADIRGDANHVITSTLRTLLPALYPANPAVAAANAEAVTELAATMSAVGRDASGPAVWSLERRQRLYDLKVAAALGIEGEEAFADEDVVETVLSALVLCEHVPNADAFESLARLLGEIVLDSAFAVVPRGVNAWALFLLRITRSIVDEMDRLARQALALLAAAIDAALRALAIAGELLAAAIAAVDAAAAAVEAALREIRRILRSNSRRTAIRNALRAQGSAAAADAVRALGGDNTAVALAIGGFNIAFDAISPVLTIAFNAAETVASDLADIMDGIRNTGDALQEIVQEVIDRVLSAITGGLSDLGLSLPAELSGSDIANAIAEALPTTVLRDWLEAAIVAGERQEQALADQAAAERAQATAADDLFLSRQRDAALRPTGRLSITIGSPTALPANLRHAVVHGPQVPMLVRVGGAASAFFRSGTERQVRLAVNGVAVNYRHNQWVPTPAGFEYREPVTLGPGSGLRAGLNVLEVSVVDGIETLLRTTQSFLVDPSAPSLVGSLVVDPALSLFDVRGDDHVESEQERVAFRWSGGAPLSLRSWRLIDRDARHVYRFDEVQIAPGGLMVVRTGGDPADNGGETLHWGRRSAVWNNRQGDTVVLADASGFVRATFDVPPRPRSR